MLDGYDNLISSANKHFQETLIISKSIADAKKDLLLNKKKILDKVDCAITIQNRVTMLAQSMRGTPLESKAIQTYNVAIANGNVATRISRIVSERYLTIENQISQGFITTEESEVLVKSLKEFHRECIAYNELCSESNVMIAHMHNHLLRLKRSQN